MKQTMNAGDVRNWLGLYVLFLTACVGAYSFMAPQALLPLSASDRVSATEIVLPFLLGQVAAVFRFYSAPSALRHRNVPIPVWAVKAPPLLVSVILGIEFVLMGIGGVTQRAGLIPSPDSFKGLLTFSVALLNASTVFVITRYFESGSLAHAGTTDPIKDGVGGPNPA